MQSDPPGLARFLELSEAAGDWPPFWPVVIGAVLLVVVRTFGLSNPGGNANLAVMGGAVGIMAGVVVGLTHVGWPAGYAALAGFGVCLALLAVEAVAAGLAALGQR